MSKLKTQLFSALSLAALLLAAPRAQAQFAVIDLASVTQLIQQAQTLTQQLQAARAQLTQAQTLYQSMSGPRGMEQLLAGITRNYLPTDRAQLSAALQGSGSAYSALAADVNNTVAANAVLSSQQLAALPAAMQSQIGAARGAVALLQALAQEGLANSSNRFGSIQQLINAIPTATDQKGILDLQARIGAEQGMLQNEQTKLQVLNQAARSQVAALRQQEREQIIAGHGRFATRFEPSPL
jgi:type IV secretion system protein VirB5